MTDLPVEFYARHPLDVAPELLNKLLVAGDRSGRIVEVEAYLGEDDPGSHGWRGRTPRTEVMFGPPGYWYVYLSYGVHWCANVVCDANGVCGAVLIRAIEPIGGIDAMREARGRVADRNLTNGPGKLTQALGVDQRVNGALIATSELRIADDGLAPPSEATRTPRIGLSEGRGEELQYRFTC